MKVIYALNQQAFDWDKNTPTPHYPIERYESSAFVGSMICENSRQWSAMVSWWHGREKAVGSYISGSSISDRPSLNKYPDRLIYNDEVGSTFKAKYADPKNFWPDPRWTVRLGTKGSVELAHRIADKLNSRKHCDHHFIDNIMHPDTGATGSPWSAICDHIHLLCELVEVPLIINIAGDFIINSDWDRHPYDLARLQDLPCKGILFENFMSPVSLTPQYRVNLEKFMNKWSGYGVDLFNSRGWMPNGNKVWTSLPSGNIDTPTRLRLQRFEAATWEMLALRDDHNYGVNAPIWDPEPEWLKWDEMIPADRHTHSPGSSKWERKYTTPAGTLWMDVEQQDGGFIPD